MNFKKSELSVCNNATSFFILKGAAMDLEIKFTRNSSYLSRYRELILLCYPFFNHLRDSERVFAAH